jgi:hypothetical protein
MHACKPSHLNPPLSPSDPPASHHLAFARPFRFPHATDMREFHNHIHTLYCTHTRILTCNTLARVRPQTFTYSIRGVNASDRRSDAAAPAAGPAGAGAGSPHDSSGSLEGPAAPAQGQGLGQGGDVHSWELRLVQEFCDLGSLREALNAGTFKANAAAAAAPAAAAVGHEGAGAGGSGGAGGKEGPAAGAEGSAAAAPGVDLLHVLDTAQDVARAMAHLHAQASARGRARACMGRPIRQGSHGRRTPELRWQRRSLDTRAFRARLHFPGLRPLGLRPQPARF